MRRRHFDTLAPICPVCRGYQGRDAPLAIAEVYQADDGRPEIAGASSGGSDDNIVQGILHCTRPECRREYPIIDGIPILLTNLRTYLAENLLAITLRGDLAGPIESLIGDCCGTGSEFDTMRQHLSSYVWDHYGDLDPEESPGLAPPRVSADPAPNRTPQPPYTQGPDAPGSDPAPVSQPPEGPRPGSAVRTLEAGLALAGPLPPGPIIDLGCAAGRTAFALAAHTEATGALVLGVDLYFPNLRVAARAVRDGRVSYPRRRVGLAYDQRSFAIDLPGRERVDVWACDATALPFASGRFGVAVALNLLDSVRVPTQLLTAAADVLSPGGIAILSCPYDWSPAATPVEHWVGGHSQRGADRGDSATVLRQLLTPGALASSLHKFALVAERDDMPWQVRMHDRSNVTYRAHLVVAKRAAEA